LPTASPAAKPPRSRLRQWLKALLILSFVGSLGVCLAIWFAAQHLPYFAQWALERALPGARVEISKLVVTLPNRLEIGSVVLKSRKDQTTLLSLSGGTIDFSFEDILHGRIGEVRLVEPVLNASPKLLDVFSIPAGGSSKTGPAWTVRRIVCDYGELNVMGYGDPKLSVQTKFAFDFQNFSLASDRTQKHEMILWSLSAAVDQAPPFCSLDVVRLGFDFAGISQGHLIDSLRVQGGSLVVGDSLRKLFGGAPSPAGNEPWKLGEAVIENVAVRLDDNRPEIPDITFALNTTFQNVPLSQVARGLGDQEQKVEIANIEVLSPADPLAKVFTLQSITLDFSLKGLLHREINSIAVHAPTIHVGPDLFWYMDDMQKRLLAPDDPPAPAGLGWKIHQLTVESGQLVIGGNGHRKYGVPLSFHASAEDVALDDLASLKFQFALEIPEQRYVFDSYQLEFSSQGGDLRFAYPPDENRKNLVGKIFLSDVHWRQYRSSDAWVAVTFDKQGINGEFGGKAYKGYVSGGFSFFFEANSPWIGWIAGKRIDLREFTDVISPQNFRMTGPLDFRLQLDAQARDIDRIRADFQAAKPGKMIIGKLNDLLGNIPSTWNSLKQGSTRIALEALKDFDYTRGDGDLWIVRSQGILRLKLQGPTGSRNFDIVLHADDSPEGKWKQNSAER